MPKQMDAEELDAEEEELNSEMEALSDEVNEAHESFEAINTVIKDIDTSTNGLKEALAG